MLPIAAYPEPENNVFIQGTGETPITYYYPDPDNKKIEIISGKYDIYAIVTGNVDVKDKKMDFVDTDGTTKTTTIQGFKGPFPLGQISASWDIKPEEIINKKKMTFFIPVNYFTEEVSQNGWGIIADVIIQEDGNLKTKIDGKEFVVKYDEYINNFKPRFS